MILRHKLSKSMKSGLILACAVSTLIACTGVSQDEFDRVSSELDNAIEEHVQLRVDLTKSENEIADQRVDLTTYQNEVAHLRAELDGKNNDLDVATAKLSEFTHVAEVDYPNLRYQTDQASLAIEIFAEFLRIGLSGSDPDLLTSLEVLGKLDDIEDEEIRAMWDYIFEYGDFLSDEENGQILLAMLVNISESLK